MDNLVSILEVLEYEDDKNKIIEIFPVLEEKISKILNILKNSDLKDSEIYFALLAKIQNLLMILVYKKDIKISEKLRKFTCDFDRVDSLDVQNYLFNEIQNNKYCF